MKKISQARCLLLKHEPWYGHAAIGMEWVANRRTPTMGVCVAPSGRTRCHYNPDFVSGLSVAEVAAVVQHEIEHVVRCHLFRTPTSARLLWNVACDMVVNGRRTSPRIGVWDDQLGRRVVPFEDRIVWIPRQFPENEPAEVYLQRLLDDAASAPQGDCLDDHAVWQLGDTSASAGQVAARGLIGQAAASGCRPPSGLKLAIEQLQPSTIPWKVRLRRFVGRARGARTTSWTRRNRRRDEFGLPGTKQQRRRSVSIVVDVSGSVDQMTLEAFFSEIESITREADVNVLLWDDEFQGFFSQYRRGDWRNIPLHGRGGTDMVAPIRWLVERRETHDCVIMLTDGYCQWPSQQPFPFLVVCSSQPGMVTEPSWGEMIYLDRK